jgi:hypothetical protein
MYQLLYLDKDIYRFNINTGATYILNGDVWQPVQEQGWTFTYDPTLGNPNPGNFTATVRAQGLYTQRPSTTLSENPLDDK